MWCTSILSSIGGKLLIIKPNGNTVQETPEPIIEEEKPEQKKPIKSSTPTKVATEHELVPKDECITMSTKLNDKRMKPRNVVKTSNFNDGCQGTTLLFFIPWMINKDGPWW